MLSQSEIQNIVDTIVKGYHPEKVIIFGSYANGNPDEDSDLDLLIIKNTETGYMERRREVRRLFNPYTWQMDIIVYTPEEYEKQKLKFNSLGYIVNAEGKIAYGK